MVDRSEGLRRRRARSAVPRRRQAVIRFSEEEYGLVAEKAALVGVAVGAWIGDVALRAATDGPVGSVRLAEIVRLHADVVSLGAREGAGTSDEVGRLLARLDSVIDALVAEHLQQAK